MSSTPTHAGDGFGELEGVAHRSCFDLTQHQEHSRPNSLGLIPDTQRFIPHVIEPASGLTRGVLVCFVKPTIRSEPTQSGIMRFHPQMAPIKAAVFPLTTKTAFPKSLRNCTWSPAAASDL